jgi:hypothetical protein
MRRATRQLELTSPPTWGGRREGAGRKPAPGRPRAPHRRRPAHDPRSPAHVTLRACTSVPSLRRDDVFGAVRSAFTNASRRVPDHTFQRAERSRPSARRRRRPHRAPSRRARTHHSRRQDHQSHARPSRQGLGRSFSCASARHAARGPERSGVHPAEFPQTSARRSRARSAVVRSVVHGVADVGRPTIRATSRRIGADMAGCRRLAAAWPRRRRRGSTPPSMI